MYITIFHQSWQFIILHNEFLVGVILAGMQPAAQPATRRADNLLPEHVTQSHPISMEKRNKYNSPNGNTKILVMIIKNTNTNNPAYKCCLGIQKYNYKKSPTRSPRVCISLGVLLFVLQPRTELSDKCPSGCYTAPGVWGWWWCDSIRVSPIPTRTEE